MRPTQAGFNVEAQAEGADAQPEYVTPSSEQTVWAPPRARPPKFADVLYGLLATICTRFRVSAPGGALSVKHEVALCLSFPAKMQILGRPWTGQMTPNDGGNL